MKKKKDTEWVLCPVNVQFLARAKLEVSMATSIIT